MSTFPLLRGTRDWSSLKNGCKPSSEPTTLMLLFVKLTSARPPFVSAQIVVSEELARDTILLLGIPSWIEILSKPPLV